MNSRYKNGDTTQEKDLPIFTQISSWYKEENVMKRLIIALFLVVSLLTTGSVQIFAEEPEYSNTESIEELYNAYLNNHDVTDRVELTPEENNELSGLIQSYKEKTLHSYPSPISRTRLNDFTGGIFIHYDSATGSLMLAYK